MSIENMTLWVGITRNIPVAIFDEHNNLIAAISSTDGSNSMDIACRMSNCWNAFHGITSQNVSTFEALVKQRDELMAENNRLSEQCRDYAAQFETDQEIIKSSGKEIHFIRAQRDDLLAACETFMGYS